MAQVIGIDELMFEAFTPEQTRCQAEIQSPLTMTDMLVLLVVRWLCRADAAAQCPPNSHEIRK